MKTVIEISDTSDQSKKTKVENTEVRGKVRLTLGTETTVVDAAELAAAARKASR